MLPREANEAKPATRVRKLKPLAKIPTKQTLASLTDEDAKLLQAVLAEQAEYVENELFEKPEAARVLLKPLFESPSRDAAPENDDSGLYSLDADDEPISSELARERWLFLRLNYCRRQVFDVLQRFAGRRLSVDGTGELLRWERETMATRSEIVRENIPLVHAMARRTRITGVDLSDLVSEGNLALLRSVNKFDCSRGYRFSTYACRSILKSFSRVAARMSRYRTHFPTEFDPALEKSDHLEKRRDEAEDNTVHELKTILGSNRAELSDVEQRVIEARFALDRDSAEGKAQTLEQVGQMIGVTKERVRQIQNKALGKLRTALETTAYA